MIPKRARGISRKETENLFRSGKKKHLKNGFLLWKPSTCAGARVAVSVAKKSAATAPARTHIRRRVQASVKKLLPQLKPVDMVIVWTAGAGAPAPDTQQLGEELAEVFLQEALYKT